MFKWMNVRVLFQLEPILINTKKAHLLTYREASHGKCRGVVLGPESKSYGNYEQN